MNVCFTESNILKIFSIIYFLETAISAHPLHECDYFKRYKTSIRQRVLIFASSSLFTLNSQQNEITTDCVYAAYFHFEVILWMSIARCIPNLLNRKTQIELSPFYYIAEQFPSKWEDKVIYIYNFIDRDKTKQESPNVSFHIFIFS